GVNTLRLRPPSSLTSGCGVVERSANWDGPWGTIGPNASAGRTPAQGSGGCGGRQRSSPTGGAANGMPRNWSTPPRSTPSTFPERVSTCVMSPSGRAVPTRREAYDGTRAGQEVAGEVEPARSRVVTVDVCERRANLAKATTSSPLRRAIRPGKNQG